MFVLVPPVAQWCPAGQSASLVAGKVFVVVAGKVIVSTYILGLKGPSMTLMETHPPLKAPKDQRPPCQAVARVVDSCQKKWLKSKIRRDTISLLDERAQLTRPHRSIRAGPLHAIENALQQDPQVLHGVLPATNAFCARLMRSKPGH